MKHSAFFIILALAITGAGCQKSTTQDSLTNQQTNVGASVTNFSNNNVGDTLNTNNRATSDPVTSVGKYIDYSDSVIAETAGRKILFFHAPWCPQCRKLEQSITSGVIPANVTIIKVDYDSKQSLRQQYGVTLQTTVVLVDDQGGLVKKFNAYDEPSLDRVVQELL